MKAILVIDMPDTCNDCPMMAWDEDDNWLGCYLTKKQTGVWCAEVGKPVDCPLKPMPKKKSVQANDITDLVEYATYLDEIAQKLIIKTRLESEKFVAMGWNVCLEEIEK